MFVPEFIPVLVFAPVLVPVFIMVLEILTVIVTAPELLPVIELAPDILPVVFLTLVIPLVVPAQNLNQVIATVSDVIQVAMVPSLP